MAKTYPCIARAVDGTPCGRRTKIPNDFCHLHRGVAAGQPIGQPFQPKPQPKLTITEKLEALMEHKDPTVQMRAIDIFFKRLEQKSECPVCAARRDDRLDDAIERLTDDQREEIFFHLDMVDAIKKVALTQPARPRSQDPFIEPPPATNPPAPPAPQFTVAAPSEKTKPDAATDDDATVANRLPEPVRLHKSLWESAGIYTVRGILTHARGDDYAADILSGKIPLDQAVAETASRSLVNRSLLHQELDS